MPIVLKFYSDVLPAISRNLYQKMSWIFLILWMVVILPFRRVLIVNLVLQAKFSLFIMSITMALFIKSKFFYSCCAILHHARGFCVLFLMLYFFPFYSSFLANKKGWFSFSQAASALSLPSLLL